MQLSYKMMDEKNKKIIKIYIGSLIWLQLFCVYLSLISLLSRDWIGFNGLFNSYYNYPFLKCASKLKCGNYFEKLSKTATAFIAITILCGLLVIFSVYNLSKSFKKGVGIRKTIISAIVIFLVRLGVFIGFAATMEIKIKQYKKYDYDEHILGYGGKLWIALIIIEFVIVIICFWISDKVKINNTKEEEKGVDRDINNEESDLGSDARVIRNKSENNDKETCRPDADDNVVG